MYQELVNKEAKLAVIGLGYVGLPLALEFAKKIQVIGFDINDKRVEMMRNSIDPSNELEKEAFDNCAIEFTSDLEKLKEATFYVVAVPTPVDSHNVPDLTPVIRASETVGKVIKKGDYVVYESTVYPGCTEEDCLPIIDKLSGLKAGVDYKFGYSPERINPGDKVHTLTNTTKIVSGNDAESLDEIAKVYEMIITVGVHRAPSVKVAEAGKIIENTQRDLNIALMNELSIIFDKMGINTYDVIEAAGTKWNFHKYSPGLVGGHCIGVDPYYLIYKASQLGFQSRVILSGRSINDGMSNWVATRTAQHIIKSGKEISKSKILVLGATFKENVSDIRNSKVADLVNELKGFNAVVEVVDPNADAEEFMHEYKLELTPSIGKDYDAIVLAVNHREYEELDETYFQSICTDHAVIVDIKGALRGKISKLKYWCI
ncbi:MAG TPA: nucleotide sugar dehydrogenase [Chitinophagaceae bacterium]|nr:nucleotide sugar dehydrogenase [Chitinophagaceae bacterium]